MSTVRRGVQIPAGYIPLNECKRRLKHRTTKAICADIEAGRLHAYRFGPERKRGYPILVKEDEFTVYQELWYTLQPTG